jgi:hypothetical protein
VGLSHGEQRHAVARGVQEVVEIHDRSTDDAGQSYDDAGRAGRDLTGRLRSAHLIAKCAGTRIEAQELDGVLWRTSRARCGRGPRWMRLGSTLPRRLPPVELGDSEVDATSPSPAEQARRAARRSFLGQRKARQRSATRRASATKERKGRTDVFYRR